MELRYQFVYGIELQFRTSATNEGQPHGLIVNISIKIKDMHLNATVYAIIQCRAVADTQHPRMLFPAKENINGIYPVSRNQFFTIANAQISSWKTYLTANAVTVHNRTVQKKLITQTVCRLRNVSLQQKAADS